MGVCVHHQVMIFTTPYRLREIADEMESKWPTLRGGESKVIASFWGHDVEVQIAVDQNRMPLGEKTDGR